ncbi:MAG: type VI secretion system contractile sheath large subunit, partial [Myxococcota bacterium]
GSLDISPTEVKHQAMVRIASEAELNPNVGFYDGDLSIGEGDRFVNSLAVLLLNAGMDRCGSIRELMNEIDALRVKLDERISEDIHDVVQSESFRRIESAWRSLDEMSSQVESDEVIIDFLDADKETIAIDLEDHSSDILGSALFKKVYVAEYDRFGGRPFSSIIGLYDFDAGDDDMDFIETMSKVARASHAPFVAAANAAFFGCKRYEEIDKLGNLDDLMNLPRYGRWNAFRESDSAAYVGLTLPRYMIRKPWSADQRGCKKLGFEEKINSSDDYLWANASVLFARNMINSFETSGWCQHIAGPRGGGMIKGLPVHVVHRHGHEEVQPPVEIGIPDYRELQFAQNGFLPLVHQAGSANAAFFSARSAKKAMVYEDDLDTANADLVCNLAYTMSITRIAHLTKRMVRDYIGSTADGSYIRDMLNRWLSQYVTTVVDPDDLTLKYYPFKAATVEVEPRPGPLGWYNCTISVLPHVQFEGMDVELRLEAALGGS